MIFSNAREGRAEVIVSPLERLTPKARATIEEVGTPQGVLESIGQFLTGNYLEPGDVVGKESVKVRWVMGHYPSMVQLSASVM